MINYQRNQDQVSVYIRNMISGLTATSPEQSTFRVHHQLQVNEKAYEPEILAIGPYQNGKEIFKFMEEQKLWYVEQLLGRRNEGSVDGYMPNLRELEQRARNCYAETVDLPREKFLAMMLVDSCFIVELFRKYKMAELRGKDDPIMEADWIRSCLPRDLLLLENQIPFFVLDELYGLTQGQGEPSELIDVATRYFGFKLRGSSQNVMPRGALRESKHLLNLMHTCWTSGLPNAPWPNHRTSPTMAKEELVFMSSATKLRESGVRFKEGRDRHLMDIKFKKGILDIPIFRVEDHTESWLRNLVAYEQHHRGRDTNYYTDYVTFMDCPVNSSKDVEQLCCEGIIQNYLGDDEVVAQMFNKMGDYVTLSTLYSADLFHEVNAHSKKSRNRWMAKLMREYLHSPWALLSISATTMLLLLTIAQTVFAVLPYGKERKEGSMFV